MFKGIALYQLEGAAAEMGSWSVDLYKGCGNACAHCGLYRHSDDINNEGRIPMLKRGIHGFDHAVQIVYSDVLTFLSQIRKDGGVFFSHESDPLQFSTSELNLQVALKIASLDVPVRIATRQVDWMDTAYGQWFLHEWAKDLKDKISFGFYLSGCDVKELGCATTLERINAMHRLHEMGFKTFAVIEPVYDFNIALSLIEQTTADCDHYVIGRPELTPGSIDEVVTFVNGVRARVKESRRTVFFLRAMRELWGGDFVIGENFVCENFKERELENA